MTADEFLDSLKEAIETHFGLPVVLLPQRASTNSARIEILFQRVAECGEGNEKLVFAAEFRTDGTHWKWLGKTISFCRKVHRLSDAYMPFVADGLELRCYWIKNGDAGWRWPSEEERSMPAEYVDSWRLEIDIPDNLLEGE